MMGVYLSCTQRLGINDEQWFTLSIEFEQHFSTAAGSEDMLQQYKNKSYVGCLSKLI
jgi:hypothetical protein